MKIMDDYSDHMQELHNHNDFLTIKIQQQCLQLRESTLKIEKRDKVMKEAMTQANNVAHKWVDLAGFARELKQIDNSTPKHEWKLNWLLNEIEGYLNDDNLLIQFFHDSLAGPVVVWYNRLNKEQIKTWVNLADAFLGICPNMEMMAAQVQPPLLEEEISCQFLKPKPIKLPPNPSAHNYDQDSVCDFHLGALGHATVNCRMLFKEIEMLVENGTLTQELVEQ
ncbi:hypothetical protein F3Y22_tig00110945pilonHSYRG00029 [Hibiscus syriacus]|uniref:Retrotransposon gag domain-containing protein n=1 Tax=Hibiscus syriacus TaxID=106335 RepID=A0A6A2ZBL8_HIBSY|nr:hypothetical protein F3Y22_tig00110945pilonHSYRG00029 [Hibiscus syriacus]